MMRHQQPRKISAMKQPTRFLRRLAGDKRGNALMIFGLSVLPLMFATGMGIDYSHAARLQTKLRMVS